MSTLNLMNFSKNDEMNYYEEIKDYLTSNDFSKTTKEYISKELPKLKDLTSYTTKNFINYIDRKLDDIYKHRDKRLEEKKLLDALFAELSNTELKKESFIEVIKNHVDNFDSNSITKARLHGLILHIDSSALENVVCLKTIETIAESIKINTMVIDNSINFRLNQYERLRKFLVILFKEQ